MGASHLRSAPDPEADERPAAEEAGEAPSAPPPAGAVADGPSFAVAGHDALFVGPEDAELCDVCGEVVPEDAEDAHALSGRALYLWTRGDETRREEPPLCASCAAALGLTALARWEIEEEEG